MRRADQSSGEIPRRPLGRTGVEVSAIALSGYHLGLVKTKREAIRIVEEAFDAGITFMDNGWEYHDGLSEEIMGQGLRGRRHNSFLMTKVCTQRKH
jgi:aryl-alcohol dehydrogenase-like predicted oxidoreductase